MDSKKAMLILGLMAMVLLISSEVSARDLTETSTNTKEEVVEKSTELNDAKLGYGHGHGGYYGGGGHHGGYYGGGGHHGGYHDSVGLHGGYYGGGGHHGGHGGYYGGGGHGGHGAASDNGN
ncbi:unnamed protein product [Vicia faba]|uniref:Cold and drought-regulated protein CORA-like n=1 Tax=Vicia faba TaxID=3906 RepID=A0AAV0YPK4_VICFA|nr:unnamed protein product [Vicia faba]